MRRKNGETYDYMWMCSIRGDSKTHSTIMLCSQKISKHITKSGRTKKGQAFLKEYPLDESDLLRSIVLVTSPCLRMSLLSWGRDPSDPPGSLRWGPRILFVEGKDQLRLHSRSN
jgi:hypothetical protein